MLLQTPRIISLASLLSWTLLVQGQPDIQWQKCLGGTDHEEAFAIQQTSDGGYIVAGSTASNNGDVSGNHGYDDAWVVKLDGYGTLEWQKCFGGTNEDLANTIQQTTDGGYIFAGQTASNNGDVSGNNGGVDAWVVKLDGSGNIQWQKCLGGTDHEKAYAIQQTNDGYIMAGHTESNDGDVSGNHGWTDAWVVKLDASGTLQWQKCLGGAGFDFANAIQLTDDEGYIMTGHTTSNDGDISGNHGAFDAWVVMLDSSGNILWQQCLGGTNDDRAQAIQQATDGGYIMAGSTASNDGDVSGNHGWSDAWVVKLGASGTLQWQKSLGGTNEDRANTIQQTADEGYIMAGYTVSNDGDVSGNHGGWDVWVVKLDDSGTLQWQKCLGGTSTDEAHAIQQTSDGGYITAGRGLSNNGDVSGNHGSTDYWVVKLGPDNTGTGMDEMGEERFSITPNPATAFVAITFAPQPQPQPRHLVLLDATGRLVLSQPIANMAGPVTLDLSAHESGLYLVQVLFGDGTRSVERVVME